MLAAVGLVSFASRCPAPLVFTPGEGWRYEKFGESGKWTRARAKDQLEVAQEAFDKKQYSLAMKAARRTVNIWQFSDFAPQAQYLMGRCHEAKGEDEAAFKAYQKLIERYPKVANYDEVLLRQMTIANRFLAGQWFKLFNTVPFFASMDKTIKLYEKIIKNGPYSEVAPQAQINVGKAHENKVFKEYPEAVRAYEKAADRYADQKAGKEALYLVGDTYYKQAGRAEYDQSVAGQSIATFTDFITLHPDDARVTEATKKIGTLKMEQARGAMDIARYYERNHKWEGAKIYYNAVVDALKDKPADPQVQDALRRIESINKRLTPAK